MADPVLLQKFIVTLFAPVTWPGLKDKPACSVGFTTLMRMSAAATPVTVKLCAAQVFAATDVGDKETLKREYLESGVPLPILSFILSTPFGPRILVPAAGLDADVVQLKLKVSTKLTSGATKFVAPQPPGMLRRRIPPRGLLR